MIRAGRLGLALTGAAVALRPGSASAHIVSSRLGDFYAGVAHPFTSLEDVLLWAALGLLAGLQPPGRARWIVLLFPLGLMAGFLAGLLGGPARGQALLDSALMLGLGGATAMSVRLPSAALGSVAVLVAALRGMAGANGVGSGTDVPLFALGTVAAGYAAITLSAAAAVAFLSRGGWRVVAVRAGGSWIAAIGLMFGGFALAAG